MSPSSPALAFDAPSSPRAVRRSRPGRALALIAGLLVSSASAGLLAGCGGSDSDQETTGAGGSVSAGAAGASGGGAGKSGGGAGGAGAGQSGAGGTVYGGSGQGGQAGAASGAGTGGSAGASGADAGGSAGASGEAGAAAEAGQAGAAGTGGAAGAGEAGGASGGAGEAGGAGGASGQSGAAGSQIGGSGQGGASGQAGGGAGGASGQGGAGGGQPVTFLDSYPLKAQYPEGGTYDPGAQAFYVGSLGDGSVHRVDVATGTETVLFKETAPGTWWTLGMDVDVARRRLWVCAMDDRSPDPRAGSIWVFDLVTGERIANQPLSSVATDATCTDVALTKDGRGYVGDREQGRIYRVGLGETPSLFVSDDELKAAFVGQNSMVVLPDESALLSLVYLPSRIDRVSLINKSVKRVDISGTFSDLSPLAGADGMTLHNGSAYVAFTSKVVKVTPTLSDWSAASSKAVTVPSGMTDVVSTPGGLYLLNGQSVRFALGNTPDPFRLARFVDSF